MLLLHKLHSTQIKADQSSMPPARSDAHRAEYLNSQLAFYGRYGEAVSTTRS